MNDEFYKTLGNLHSLRAALKDMAPNDLRDLVHKLNIIIEEKDRAEKEAKRQEEEKIEKVNLLRAELEKYGLTPDDLVTEETKRDLMRPHKKTRKTNPKYQYIDESGQTKTWTGQGRTPTPIKKQMEEKNKTLDDFLIENASTN
ncbi:H-NS family nucleoid-associated regulatory protein [Acerihabitans sp. TG2]|uniref:H-NS family histone-like protein n=1 Tax=Acerihabitans sp. TG2 TaxID=3096008 RepID=UPI002B22801D|nr:H-NS family nucleoid-associated regulatory protein [Acerihabitans sp. TG2]MEA9392213.1 H-NS family nucleoid-associated regulatory protein [Acerihabitans sp. TG2]